MGTEIKRIALYGIALAAGTLALQWLDYRRLARTHTGDVALFVVAAAFLALGVWLGARVVRGPFIPFDGNPRAVAALAITPRELAVLGELAAGRSNKAIAATLGVSPNTVKTHVAHLYGKLGAGGRVDAINRARDLGIVR